MNRWFSTNELALFRTGILLSVAMMISVLSSTSAHSAWFERFLLNKNDTADNTHTVKDAERDEIFIIDDYIYDARQTCYLAVGDQVVFSKGQYGIDYHATIYGLNSLEHCELLLRDPVT